MKRILFLIALGAAPALRGQDSSAYYRTAPAPAAKDGTVAFALSFVLPGLGQMYAGEPALGAGFLAVTGAAIGVAIQGAGEVERCRPAVSGNVECHFERRDPDKITAGIVVAGMAWLASMAEAPAAARQFNARHRIAFRVEPGPAGSTRIGVSVAR